MPGNVILWQEKVEEGMALEILRAHVVLEILRASTAVIKLPGSQPRPQGPRREKLPTNEKEVQYSELDPLNLFVH